MDFPIYRMLKADPGAGGRSRFPTCQYFMFLSAQETLNVRIDNVTSIGYAKDMPPDVSIDMIETWAQISAETFQRAYQQARRVIGLVEEMAL